ncbi:MAG: hypothetical protein KME16_28190 [Scytolyngbya sp. HA4215-MV1]|jgi:hypothetical protein|nr:hypothetical protein [Scytolyngbya sp. HA4215-MV1]
MTPDMRLETVLTSSSEVEISNISSSSVDRSNFQQRVPNVLALFLSAGLWMGNTPVVASPGISVTQRDGNVTIKACIKSAEQGFKKLKFSNIKSGETFVEADYQEYSVFVTCYEVQSIEDVVVQSVVVAGPDSKVASQLSDKLLKAMP